TASSAALPSCATGLGSSRRSGSPKASGRPTSGTARWGGCKRFSGSMFSGSTFGFQVLGFQVLALNVASLCCLPLDLAAGRPAHGPARHYRNFVHIQTEEIADPLPDFARQHLWRHGAARFDGDHHSIRAAVLDEGERRDAAAPHAGEIVDRPLEIL